MPPITIRVCSDCMLVKSVGAKVSWANSQMQVTVENFTLPQFHTKIVEIGGVAIYIPFGNFSELNFSVTYMVLKANDMRTSSPLSLNFVSLDLTASDR
ncbi:hypothetical protein TNCV_1739391 [Trichonephila clavipes]|nr:hypothetical protein TNCV_1739391 [Trichonephila clavipes]